LTLTVGLCGKAAASPPSVAVVAFNQAGTAAAALARAKTEVTRIFGEAGVGVSWMNPSAVEPAGAFAMQLLIRPRAINGDRSIMGTAIGDMHETGGSAFVYYDRVVRAAHESEQDVARLLAYAMAHEMGHLLLPSPAHATSGIMRPEWDGDDLRHIASGLLQFTAVQANAIRAKASGCCAATAATTSARLAVTETVTVRVSREPVLPTRATPN
jgi:hypothetical protein